MALTEIEVEALSTQNEPKLSMNYFSPSESDKRWLGVVVGLALQGYVAAGRFGAMMVFGLGAVTFLRLTNGRLYSLTWHVVRSVWLTRVKKGMVWQSAPLHAGSRRRRWDGNGLIERPRPIPLEVNTIGLDGEIGILHHPETGTDSLVITGEGSNISSLSQRAQYDVAQRLAEAIKKVASLKGWKVGWSFVFRRCPPNLEELGNFARANLHPEAALPEGLITPWDELTTEQKRWMRLNQNWNEVVELVKFLGTDAVMAAVATVRRQGKLSEAASGKALDPDVINRLPISKVATTAENELAACGVVNPTTLGLRGLQGYLRRLWDVVTLPAYHRWEASTPSVEELLDPSNDRMWPQHEIVAHHDHLVMDGTYHSFIRITKRPPDSLPSFFSQIFAIQVQYLTVTLVGEVARSNREVHLRDWGSAAMEEVENWRGHGYKRKPVEARERARKERHERIFVSRFGQRFIVLIAVSSSTRDQLEEDIDAVQTKLNLMGVDGKRVTLASQQLPALLTTTGLNML